MNLRLVSWAGAGSARLSLKTGNVATGGRLFNQLAVYVNLPCHLPLHIYSMAVDHAQVKKIARLARLHISQDEVDDYAQNLSKILDLVEQMNAADTEAVVPMAHPQDGRLRLREDIVDQPDNREAFQRIAPATEAGLYLVPKVVE